MSAAGNFIEFHFNKLYARIEAKLFEHDWMVVRAASHVAYVFVCILAIVAAIVGFIWFAIMIGSFWYNVPFGGLDKGSMARVLLTLVCSLATLIGIGIGGHEFFESEEKRRKKQQQFVSTLAQDSSRPTGGW